MKITKKESELILCVCAVLTELPEGTSGYQKMLNETQEKVAADISVMIANSFLTPAALKSGVAEIVFPQLYKDFLKEVLGSIKSGKLLAEKFAM